LSIVIYLLFDFCDLEFITQIKGMFFKIIFLFGILGFEHCHLFVI